SVIQLIEALTYHGKLLDQVTYNRWKNRVEKAAEFLCGFQEFEVCNINYRLTNGLAMHLCGEFLGVEKYTERGSELMKSSIDYISESGILCGEGRPISGISKRGCRPVDIGYNMEESLPSMIQYAYQSGNEEIKKVAIKALNRHLIFMLGDGGMDNSFGTRNYKWTYWGSRTSDGCALGYLLAADQEPIFGIAAYKNLKLLEKCTHDGFLYGGPHLYEIGELPCVHHAFSHAKVLAGILDQGIEDRLCDGMLPRQQMAEVNYLPEVDTYLIPGKGYTATVTGYDWEYTNLKGGHASGGMMSMLWHEKAGLILCAGMGCYTMKEPSNMQLPKWKHHECLTPRTEYKDEENRYSSMYDDHCHLSFEQKDGIPVILAEGIESDMKQRADQNGCGKYQMEYRFEAKRILFSIQTDNRSSFILPIISRHSECVSVTDLGIKIQKEEIDLCLEITVGIMILPYKTERIYNLVPGVEAVKVVIKPVNGKIAFCLSF
ncbi:MAG: hypothetical protein RSF83_06250, partial [Hungatella sp.]